jgi:tetratricopeptide (TPR) repeat protein
MGRVFGNFHIIALLLVCGYPARSAFAQQAKTPPASESSPETAIALAEHGQCRQAISGLRRAMASQVPSATRKEAGVNGVRCSLEVDDRGATLEFIRQLSKQFPKDPDVLFVVVHAYSDLSTRTAQDLARTAPHSIAAHKLNAEALEMQGKWEPAQLEYEEILKKQPNARGIHFLLGRLLLSRPDAGSDVTVRARQEFTKELAIDPNNSAAEYILGELARRDQNWDEAVARFSQAAKLNPHFAEAYLGWGASLVADKKYQEAIPPLRTAERLTPQNPDIHHALATALVRSGHKEEADKEFAIHRSLSANDQSAAPTPSPE